MTTNRQEARSAIDKARVALANGDRRQARIWAEEAAKLAPQMEEPWLILAAIAGPRQGVEYIRKALEVNPESQHAQRGMEWVKQHLGDTPAEPEPTTPPATETQPRRAADKAAPGAKPGRRRVLLLAGMLLVTGCGILALAGWTAINSPVLASMLPQASMDAQPTLAEWAQVSIAKPTYTSAAPQAAQAFPTAKPTAMPEATATPQESTGITEFSTALRTDPPTSDDALPSATEWATAETSEPPTEEPVWTGELVMEVLPDTPTPEAPPYVPPTAPAPIPDGTGYGEHWIDVNLSQQMVYAYAGDTVVNSFVVSTGTWLTPTVTGKYHIWVKLRYSDMSGPGYYLPDVPYVMYFYKDYGLHGTYWHNNFGTPMSHGCVNLSIPDAEWVYNFSSVGTVVNVHY